MSACVETVLYMFLATWGSNWLNENYPRDYNWFGIISLFALLKVAHTWYLILRLLIRDQNNSSSKEQDKGIDR